MKFKLRFLNKFLTILTIGILLSVLFESKASISQPENNSATKQLKSLGKEKFNYGQNITHKLVASRIITQFTPTNSQGESISLDKLALSLGYDHFNWASYVVQDPHGITNQEGQKLSTPYNDPPKGGYRYDPADQLPFYWDLEKCHQCQSRYHWQNHHNLKQYQLVFEDSPADYRLQPGEAIEFVTNLVGVKNYNFQDQTAEWEILHTFRWQLTNSYPNVSKVSLVETDVNLNHLSPMLLTTMQLDGAKLVTGY